jgi:hypothetical protein
VSRLIAWKLRRLEQRNARRRARNPLAQLIDQLERDLYGQPIIVKVKVMTLEEIQAKYGDPRPNHGSPIKSTIDYLNIERPE